MRVLRRPLLLALCAVLTAACAVAEHPRPSTTMFEGVVIFFPHQEVVFYPCDGPPKLGWQVIAHPPELVGRGGDLRYLRFEGRARPTGPPEPTILTRSGAPFQPHEVRVERVVEFRDARPEDCRR